MLIDILAFIVAIGVLVCIHEYGHFWVARRCGVKVLRFSIGFGKSLWTFHDKQGTEYVIAAIPLGGYVKMLDEREGEVAPTELDRAFNRKPRWQRVLVVLAGPAANFLFAIVAFFGLHLVGVQEPIPYVRDIVPHSPAGMAHMVEGTEIIAIDGKPTLTWSDILRRWHTWEKREASTLRCQIPSAKKSAIMFYH